MLMAEQPIQMLQMALAMAEQQPSGNVRLFSDKERVFLAQRTRFKNENVFYGI